MNYGKYNLTQWGTVVSIKSEVTAFFELKDVKFIVTQFVLGKTYVLLLGEEQFHHYSIPSLTLNFRGTLGEYNLKRSYIGEDVFMVTSPTGIVVFSAQKPKKTPIKAAYFSATKNYLISFDKFTIKVYQIKTGLKAFEFNAPSNSSPTQRTYITFDIDAKFPLTMLNFDKWSYVAISTTEQIKYPNFGVIQKFLELESLIKTQIVFTADFFVSFCCLENPVPFYYADFKHKSPQLKQTGDIINIEDAKSTNFYLPTSWNQLQLCNKATLKMILQSKVVVEEKLQPEKKQSDSFEIQELISNEFDDKKSVIGGKQKKAKKIQKTPKKPSENKNDQVNWSQIKSFEKFDMFKEICFKNW